MTTFVEKLKQLAQRLGGGAEADHSRRHNPEFVGHANAKDIEEAPPERAAELAGHPTERVDT